MALSEPRQSVRTFGDEGPDLASRIHELYYRGPKHRKDDDTAKESHGNTTDCKRLADDSRGDWHFAYPWTKPSPSS